MKLKHFEGKENGMGHRGYKLNHVEIKISQVGGEEREGDLEGQGMMLVLAVVGNQVVSEIVFEQHCASQPTQATAQGQKMQTHLRPKVCFSGKLSHIQPALQRIGRFETLNRINIYCEGLLSLLTVFLDNDSFFPYSFSVSHWYFAHNGALWWVFQGRWARSRF